MLTVVYALLFYAATALLLGGLAYKVRQYARAAVPLKIPTMPAPGCSWEASLTTTSRRGTVSFY